MDNVKYKRNCPSCGREVTYAFYQGLYKAKTQNRVCNSCRVSGNKNPMFGIRLTGNLNPMFGKTGFGGKTHTLQTKEILHTINSGPNHPQYGTSHSSERRHKQRLYHINKLRLLGIFPGSGMKKTYNPNACMFMDKLNKQLGTNFQHAKNGGEVELYGFFVDGYDKEKNIIFEYDERRHYNVDGTLVDKDIKRQSELIKNVNPTLFLRYDEDNQRLYNSITQENIILE